MSNELYHCNSCGEDCWEPTRYKTVDREEFWGERVDLVEITEVCPACGSDDLDEAAVCRTCGVYRAMSGYDNCRDCQARADDAERLAETLVDIGRAGAGAL